MLLKNDFLDTCSCFNKVSIVNINNKNIMLCAKKKREIIEDECNKTYVVILIKYW